MWGKTQPESNQPSEGETAWHHVSVHRVRMLLVQYSPYEEEQAAAGADGCFCSSRLIPPNCNVMGMHVHVKGKESLEEPVSSYKAQGSAPRDKRTGTDWEAV